MNIQVIDQISDIVEAAYEDAKREFFIVMHGVDCAVKFQKKGQPTLEVKIFVDACKKQDSDRFEKLIRQRIGQKFPNLEPRVLLNLQIIPKGGIH